MKYTFMGVTLTITDFPGIALLKALCLEITPLGTPSVTLSGNTVAFPKY
jgi:hypothetical protein